MAKLLATRLTRLQWTLVPSRDMALSVCARPGPSCQANPRSMDDGKYFPSLEMNISVAVKVTYEHRIPAHLRVCDTYAGPSHT